MPLRLNLYARTRGMLFEEEEEEEEEEK